MTAKHRGTFAVPGPRWLKALIIFIAIPIEYGVYRLTGWQLPNARWE